VHVTGSRLIRVCSQVPHHPVIVGDNVARTESSRRMSVEFTGRVGRPVVDRVTDVVAISVEVVVVPGGGVDDGSGSGGGGGGSGRREVKTIMADGSHRRRAGHRGSCSPHQ